MMTLIMTNDYKLCLGRGDEVKNANEISRQDLYFLKLGSLIRM